MNRYRKRQGKIITLALWMTLSLMVFPLNCASEEETPQICNLVRHQIDTIHDGDGMELADINDDGKIDIVIAESVAGKVSWYEQGDSLDSWTKHEIASGYIKIEGVDVLEINGDPYVIILDQTGNEVVIAGAKEGKFTEEWKTETLDGDAPYVQCSLEGDIDEDGDMDFFYAYEGKERHEGGALCWLEYLGGDPLDQNNWEKHTVTDQPGAWWIAQQHMDLNGNGNSSEIVFTSRYDKDSGIFWAEPSENVTDQWKVHTIEDGKDYAPLHVTVGNFFDDGNEYDIAAGAMEKGEGAYLYRFSDEYSRHVLREDGKFHNIIGLDLDNEGADELILVRGKALLSVFLDNIILYQHDGQQYVQRWKEIYRKADDRIIPYDLDGDGYNEVITVAANDNSVDWWEVKFGICLPPLFWDVLLIILVIGFIALAFLIIQKADLKTIHLGARNSEKEPSVGGSI